MKIQFSQHEAYEALRWSYDANVARKPSLVLCLLVLNDITNFCKLSKLKEKKRKENYTTMFYFQHLYAEPVYILSFLDKTIFIYIMLIKINTFYFTAGECGKCWPSRIST